MCIRDRNTIKTLRGEKSVKEWESFISGIKPLSQIINEIPLLSFSPESINFLDLINLTSKFLPNINQIPKINKGFGNLVNNHLEDPFLRNWVDLLSFLISGMSMHDTNTAAMLLYLTNGLNQIHTLNTLKEVVNLS